MMAKPIRAQELHYSMIQFPISIYREKYIEDSTRWRKDINFIFEWQNNILWTTAASE